MFSRQPRTSFNGSEFDVTSQPPEDEDRMVEEKREIVNENYNKGTFLSLLIRRTL